MNHNELRKELTDKIITAIENGTVPWRRPWGGRHRNAVSLKAYSGINPLLLQIHAEKHDFRSTDWATFAQWKDMGCVVKKRPATVNSGEWGCRIVFYKPVATRVTDAVTGEEEDERFFVMRTYTVFNADQVDGEKAEELRSHPHDTLPDFGPAEELIVATGADIRHGGDRAYYSRPTPDGSFPKHTGGDFIMLPLKSVFNPIGAYYETAFHELAHWTEVRLGWDRKGEGYAKGELIAEMASCYLASELGVPQGEGLENHAAYLKHWLEGMRGDPSFIFKAATQASKVTDHLLSFVAAANTVRLPSSVFAHAES